MSPQLRERLATFEYSIFHIKSTSLQINTSTEENPSKKLDWNLMYLSLYKLFTNTIHYLVIVIIILITFINWINKDGKINKKIKKGFVKNHNNDNGRAIRE